MFGFHNGLERWDIVGIPPDLLGMVDLEFPLQFGVVVSSPAVRDNADRLWLVHIRVPSPPSQIEGDIEVPYLSSILGFDPVIIRTASIIAIHKDDLSPQAVVQLQRPYRKQIVRMFDKFLPRRI